MSLARYPRWDPSSPPLVSVLVNNHDYGEFVVGCVRSALQQTHRNVEVIVVDDGSSDDSLQRLAALRDPRLRIVRQANGGQGSAYNTAWALATGRYVLFLDADDRLDPSLLERALPLFDDGTAKVQFRLRMIDRHGGAIGRTHPPELEDTSARASVLRYGIHAGPPGSGNLFCRRYLEQVMPIPDPRLFRTAADTWPILMAPFFGTVRTLPAPGGDYRLSSPLDPMRMLGNANADPAANLAKTEDVTQAVLRHLHALGRTDRVIAPMPAPFVLRAWALMRVDGRPVPARVYGRRVGPALMVRSVLGWRPYGPVKKLRYLAFLVGAVVLPPSWARSLIRRFGRYVRPLRPATG